MKEKQNTLGFLLSRASNSMSVHLNTLLKKNGIDLPHSQYVILKHLYDEDGISQQELADKIYKDTAAIKRTLDILEKKGLIQRIPVTMRKNSVIITEQGKELIPKVMDCLERSKQFVLSGISEQEYKLFTDILERIYQNTK
ncbi:MarR family transcriptional regulator [uncultured Parabacteroides sp.]|uniref:MarR family winged helix-turn-helix transcriptional regulator n=1 Tax=uncultured Parabacteroides sp. TaxID=512312 RepID=UPI002596E050|nr:MarR family transcriptional regulator [uncultured Parabacteroides sp.]